eukprot:GHVR01154688.1.p2 GENE.GHVR01154688.1~~GHVR01154688.1.p2  ORF type:complete len:168 (+),score=24.16 GHVR01154688.1:172-675(+)
MPKVVEGESTEQVDMSVLDTRWVPKLLNEKSFLQWKVLWTLSSKVYLNEGRFKNTGLEREDIYKLALLKAAEGNNKITMDLITIFQTRDSIVPVCENFIKRLEKLYLSNTVEQKMTVAKNMRNLSRQDGESLKSLLSRLDSLLVEAQLVKYKPENDTKMIALLQSVM